MTTATITTKGQITIPKPVRETMNLHAGDRLEFIQINDERYEIIPVTKDITELKGIVKTNKTASIEDMNKAIEKMAGQL